MKNLIKSSWREEKAEIQRVNSDLYKAICELGPPEDIPIYRAKYPYGAKMLDAGRLMIIDDSGNEVPVLSEKVPVEFQKDLTYGPTFPMGMVLSKTIELYIETPIRPIPFCLFTPGQLFALNGVLNTQTSFGEGDFWEATAGCRSTFLSTKFSNNKVMTKLERDFQITLYQPKNYYDHWGIFKALSNAMESDWHVDVLYFPKQWFPDKPTIAWKAFKCFLFECSWYKNRYWRNAHLHDLAYALLTQTSLNSKPNLFVNKVVKHVLETSVGMHPGFVFASNNSTIPLEMLTRLITEYHVTKEIYPTIMTQGYVERDDFVYYSLLLQSHLDFTTSLTSSSRRVSDLYEIMKFISRLKHSIDSDLFSLEGNQHELLSAIAENRINGFHYLNQKHGFTNSAISLLERDPNLSLIKEKADNAKLEICTKSPIFSGLVSIQRKVS